MNQDIKAALTEICSSVPVIDTHEHLRGASPSYAGWNEDIFYALDYLLDDMYCAGLGTEGMNFLTGRHPLMEKWGAAEPYYSLALNTGYGSAHCRTLARYFGEERLTTENIGSVNERFQALTRAPEHLRQVLQKDCGIVRSVRICSDGAGDPALFLDSFQVDNYVMTYQLADLNTLQKAAGIPIRRYEDYEQALSAFISGKIEKEGFRIFKLGMAYYRDLDFRGYSRAEASAEFQHAFDRVERLVGQDSSAGNEFGVDHCRNFVNANLHTVLAALDRHGCVLQIHTGLFACGPNDIRNGDPTPLYSLFLKYRNVKFDIFHISYPYHAQLIAMAKLFPNVFVDMAWAHSISPNSAVNFLLECIDALPANRVLGFGGDTGTPINVYGHLALAKENLSRALTAAVADGRLSLGAAERYIERILYLNPKSLYGI